MAKRQTAAEKRAELKRRPVVDKKAEKAEAAAAKKRAKLDPAADHTYGDGAHTVGNVVIHGLDHYNGIRRKAIADWLRELVKIVEGEVNPPATFASRFNVRNL